MTYTLWRCDVQVGHTVGEVTHSPAGTLSARIQMLAAYTLPSGFAQWTTVGAQSRTIDLIVNQERSAERLEPREPRRVHADAYGKGNPAREYTGPVEHPTEATAFVLRDPDGQPLETAMLSVSDVESLFIRVLTGYEPPVPRFRLGAIFSGPLEVKPLSI